MDSEQPKSLGEILKQDRVEQFERMINSGVVIGLGVLATRYRMDGRPEVANRAEELAGRIESKMIADQILKFIPESNILNQESEIIDGEIVNTEHGLGEITDKI